MAIDLLKCGMTGQAALDLLNEAITAINDGAIGGIADIVNVGGGNEALRDIVAGVASLRSTIGTGATSVSTVGDEIRINTPSGIISSIDEDFGAIATVSGATGQVLTTTPTRLVNWTANGSNVQNTSPAFATGDVELLNTGLWTLRFNGIASISSNNRDVLFEIRANDATLPIPVVTLADFGTSPNPKAFSVDISGHFINGDEITVYAYTSTGTTTLTITDSYLSVQRGAESELSQTILDQINNNSYTGWITPPTIAANANPALFDLGPGVGVIIDRTVPETTVRNVIVFPGYTGIALAHPGTRVVNIGVIGPLVGDIIQSISAFERESRETTLVAGNLTQGPTPTNNTVEIASRVPSTNYSLDMAFRSLLDSLGGINLKGLTYSGVSGTLQLQHSPGVGLTLGRNYDTDPGFPDWPEAAAQVGMSLVEKFRAALPSLELDTKTPVLTTLDVTNFTDNNGNLIGLAPNRWQIKRVYFFYNSNTTIVYYGDVEYSSEAEVRNAVTTEEFTEHPDTFQAVFRGYILTQQGETDSDNFIYIAAGLFRSSGAGTGGQITTSMQGSYEITPIGTPQVETNGANGPVTFRDGTNTLVNVFEIENFAGTLNFSVDSAGDVVCTDISGNTSAFEVFDATAIGSNANNTYISRNIGGTPTFTVDGNGIIDCLGANFTSFVTTISANVNVVNATPQAANTEHVWSGENLATTETSWIDANGQANFATQVTVGSLLGDIGAATLGFNRLEDNGTPVPQRTTTNLVGATLVDDAGNDRNTITFSSGGITEYAELSRSAQLVIGNGVTATLIGNVVITGVPQTGTSYNTTTGETTVPVGKEGVWDIQLCAEFNANGVGSPFITMRLLVNGVIRTSNKINMPLAGLDGVAFPPSPLYLEEADVAEIVCQNSMGVTNAFEGGGYQQISTYRGLPA